MKHKRIVIGTKNKDKRRELQSLLKGAGIEVLSLGDFPHCPEAHENGKTFEANARKKARVYSRHTKMLTLADDSGLMVSALNGRPGVYSARFAGLGCTYRDNNRKVLRLLGNAPASKRKAKFVSIVALYDSGKFVGVVKGECQGRIAFTEKGKNGFGYDPIFIPNGFTRTFAELSPRAKNRLSHRAKTLRKAKRFILRFLRNSRSFCR